MNAPLFDSIIAGLPVDARYIDSKISQTLFAVYKSMTLIQPGEHDEIRSVWIEVPRGAIEDFGDYDEYMDDKEVTSHEEFENLWKEWYPDETKWYEFTTSKYKNDLFFFLNSRLLIQIAEDLEPAIPESDVPDRYSEFFGCLSIIIPENIEKLKTDTQAYLEYIEKNLPRKKRVGRILRSDYWEILGEDARRPDLNLGVDMISKFSDLVDFQKNPEDWMVIREMTADDFFNFCEICYDANEYFKEDQANMTPREKYWRMADGRHGGLMDILAGSPGEFTYWYRSGAGSGGHPWEICRGGNSTHISLYIRSVPEGWTLHLAGSSAARVEETVRMAVALFIKGIPFVLQDAQEMLRMIKGVDFIGIVPEGVIPRYCHSYFPKEDRIIDFMNLDWNYSDQFEKMVFWYPLELCRLAE